MKTLNMYSFIHKILRYYLESNRPVLKKAIVAVCQQFKLIFCLSDMFFNIFRVKILIINGQ